MLRGRAGWLRVEVRRRGMEPRLDNEDDAAGLVKCPNVRLRAARRRNALSSSTRNQRRQLLYAQRCTTTSVTNRPKVIATVRAGSRMLQLCCFRTVRMVRNVANTSCFSIDTFLVVPAPSGGITPWFQH